MICYKLGDVVENATEFCEKMGFESKAENCYSGVPASTKKGPARKKEKTKSQDYIEYFIWTSVFLAVVAVAYFVKIKY